ncbi:MAG: 16S rRNA (uracil(1498)-N(3))-methyltransferase [Ruminococcaceae bacterium]|nr:16S rRNA (uracil(1498)-N(3))-methyltransferase [Oscillospiraceae bacterium]
MPRFFVSKEHISDQFMVLTGENAAHAKVLRLKNGDEVTVCDAEGTDYRCTVSDVASGQISLVVHSVEPSQSEAKVVCSIYMAFAKADKFEHVIQKATELGASELICFPSSRCVSKPDEKSLKKKLERWQKIASSAAEQSRRGKIPTVLALPSYEAALQRAARSELAVCFYENEENLTFRAAIEEKPFTTAAILTGPEGGFSEEEIQQASEAGLRICTLGSRILRCETAPLCALSALMYAKGEF